MSVPLRFNFVLNLDTHGVLFGAGTGASGDETGTRAGTEVLDDEEEEVKRIIQTNNKLRRDYGYYGYWGYSGY